MSSRDEILARLRTALGDVTQPEPGLDVPNWWTYGKAAPAQDVLGRFVERCQDQGATVTRCDEASVADAIVRLLAGAGVGSVVLPWALMPSWRRAIENAGVIVLDDDDPLLLSIELDDVDGVVTSAAAGIAETGTVVLDHAPDQGRRALTLVPDVHLAVVRADQVVSGIPEAVARLAGAVAKGSPLTWISGPSASSAIEMSRVVGAHGPRKLIVILAE